MDLMSMPLVMIENILSFISYDEIAKFRLVSKTMNSICSRLLNRGFGIIERRHNLALKNVKAQLPRRESERRYHQLSRHCDILTSIETRISMLNMTYSKFIDHGMCCFIPGKVIDEIRRVLALVETESNPPRAHEVLQELRDISSMAIEHFDDKISPAFRKKLQDGAVIPSVSNSAVPIACREEMATLYQRSQINAKMTLYIAGQYKKIYKGIASTMSGRTNKLAYKRHAYSGPRKSFKRVRGGLRHNHGEESRLKAWRSEEMKKPVNEEIVIDNSITLLADHIHRKDNGQYVWG